MAAGNAGMIVSAYEKREPPFRGSPTVSADINFFVSYMNNLFR